MITYGRCVTVSDKRPDGTYRVGCNEHGLVKVTKQHYRANSVARGHAEKYHGMTYAWKFDGTYDWWKIDAPNDLQAIVWIAADGSYAWCVTEPTDRNQSGRVATGTNANRTAAQVSATLAIAERTPNLR